MTLRDRILGTVTLQAQDIVQRVAEHFGVKLADILAQDRHAHIADARHVAAWLLRERGLSFPSIARELARKDHTTIISAVRKVERLRMQDPAVAEALEKMKGAA